MWTLRVALLLWGSLASVSLAYYSLRWVLELQNPLRAELLIGASYALALGAVPWVGGVLVSLRQSEGGRSVALWNIPAITAIGLLSVLGVKGGL